MRGTRKPRARRAVKNDSATAAAATTGEPYMIRPNTSSPGPTRVHVPCAHEAVLSGRRYDGASSLAAGVVDAITTPDELVNTATAISANRVGKDRAITQGVGAIFQPVHTMTGIIAQEMGEVVRGSTHYRALFMVGLVLFALTLLINFVAQKFVARYRMSIG